MFDKIKFDELDHSDMEAAAAFVESISTVAKVISVADVNEQEMRDVLYVIAESLAVAGPILYSGAESAARSAHGTSVQVVA